MIVYSEKQGSEAWLQARKAVITASRFRDACDKLKGGSPSKACLGYAMDVARERVGGTVPPKFQSAAMRTGTVEEPQARIAYETETGEVVQEAGFICTDDRKFGVSVDGTVGDDGLWECKTMVSSDTLFTAMVDGDVSAYRHQCVGAMWLLHRDWIDLSLWCPDLQTLHTIRIERDDDEIEALERELVSFERLVSKYESALRAKLDRDVEPASAPAPPPWDTAAPRAAVQLPNDIFA